jgi:hypothetical protein
MSARQRHIGPGKLPHGAVDEIGYAKPPRAHQFKPGQSGNPRGRPKGAKNEATILRDLLNRKIDVRDGGRTRKITILEAILRRFAEDALKGNTKSAAFLFNRYAATQVGESQPGDDINADDRDVIADFVQRFASQLKHQRS